MQLNTDSVDSSLQHNVYPKSPGSPFSAKQRRWTGIVQQVQDSSARISHRRRQSTDAAAAADAAGAAAAGAAPSMQLLPASTAAAAASAAPTAAAGRRVSLQEACANHAATAAAAAASAAGFAGGIPRRSSSSSYQFGQGQNPAASEQVSSVIAQPRFGSLKQCLREVRRSRQPQKNSGGRASSIISDGTDDSNSVVSETSSVVEEKLQRLLLQVSANSQLNPSALQSGSNPNTGAFKNTTGSVATGSRAGSLYAASSSSRQGGSPLTGLSCGQASRGLGVTVRRFKPPSSTATGLSPADPYSAVLPGPAAAPFPHAASSPNLAGAAAPTAPTLPTTPPPAAAAADGFAYPTPLAASTMAVDHALLGPQHTADHISSSGSSVGSRTSSIRLVLQVDAAAEAAAMSQANQQMAPSNQAEVLTLHSMQPGGVPPSLLLVLPPGYGRDSTAAREAERAEAVIQAVLPPVAASASSSASSAAGSEHGYSRPGTPPTGQGAQYIQHMQTAATAAEAGSLSRPGTPPTASGSQNTPAAAAAVAESASTPFMSMHSTSGVNRRPSMLMLPVHNFANVAVCPGAAAAVGLRPYSGSIGGSTPAPPALPAAAGSTLVAALVEPAAGAKVHSAPSSAFQLPPGRSILQCSYSGAADVFNDADIQQLLQKVVACVGPAGGATPAAAAAAAAAVGADGSSGSGIGLRVETTGPGTGTTYLSSRLSLQSQIPPAGAVSTPAAAAAAAAAEPAGSTLDAAAVPAPAAPRNSGNSLTETEGSSNISTTPSSPGRRHMQRHVSWKDEVDVLTPTAAAAAVADHGATHQAMQPLVDGSNALPVIAEGDALHLEHHSHHSQYCRPQPQQQQQQQEQYLQQQQQQYQQQQQGAEQGYGGQSGVVHPRPRFGSSSGDGSSSSWQGHPSAASGAGQHAAQQWGSQVLGFTAGTKQGTSQGAAHAASAAGFLQSACSMQHHAGASAGVPAPIVMSLSSAALALQADLQQHQLAQQHQQQVLQQQQQQHRRSCEAGPELSFSGYPPGNMSSAAYALPVQQPQQQQQSGDAGRFTSAAAAGQILGMPSEVLAPQAGEGLAAGGYGYQLASAAGGGNSSTAAAAAAAAADDAVSSCCGSSELSAMANPVAYADRLTRRLVQHLGGDGGAGAAAAGAGDPGSPSSAVNLLERYLDGHQLLKQKAVRLEQNMKQRQQVRQQQQPGRKLLITNQRPYQPQAHTSSPLGGARVENGRSERVAAQAGGGRRLLRPDQHRQQIRADDDGCQLNVDELRQEMEMVLKRV